MKRGAPGAFGTQLRALREAAGFTQEELATIAGLSVQAVSALERGERKRPHLDTVRALSAALDLAGAARDALLASARAPASSAAVDELSGASLPIPQTALIGREADLSTLRAWLHDPSARLVTLVGAGGVGKTRLALELARAVAEEAAVSVRFVELAAMREASFAIRSIGDALGLPDLTDGDLPRRIKVACTKERPTLLVLDNCEQVLDAAPLVAGVLRSTVSVRVLATSRAPLRVRGERLYAVDPLVLPHPDTTAPADLVRAPAVRLFVERARDVVPDFRLTAANGRTVTAICRRLDALPLAIELAATRMRAVAPDDLLGQIERDLTLATDGPRDLPERQRTMNATVAWSYQLLDASAQRAFRRLAVMSERFPIDAAAYVLGDGVTPSTTDGALAAITALSEQSLLLRADAPGGPRATYQMLETVRGYALQQAAAAGERDEAFEGLARFCRDEAVMAAEGLRGASQVAWLERVRETRANYRVALQWLLSNGRGGDAADIVSRLGFFWLIRGHAAEGAQWSEQILRCARLPPAVEARTLGTAGMLSYARGELPRARTELRKAMELAQKTADAEVVAEAQLFLGHVSHGLGDVTLALACFERAFAGFEALSIPWGQGTSLGGMAWMAMARGQMETAEHLLERASATLRGTGPWFPSVVFYLRAVLAVRRGRADEAIALVREHLTRTREVRDRFAFVYALVPLAAAAVLKGDDAWAARIVAARDAVTARTGTIVVDDSVRDLRDSAERGARARLGPHRWARAYDAGRRASIDALLMDIETARIGD